MAGCVSAWILAKLFEEDNETKLLTAEKRNYRHFRINDPFPSETGHYSKCE